MYIFIDGDGNVFWSESVAGKHYDLADDGKLKILSIKQSEVLEWNPETVVWAPVTKVGKFG